MTEINETDLETTENEFQLDVIVYTICSENQLHEGFLKSISAESTG